MPQNFRLRFNAAPAERELRQAAARGLLLGAEHVLGVSNDRVPLDEAALQRSGTTSVDEPSLTAMVSYDTPYAVRQHEELDYRHAPGREAKYLENSLNAERAVVLALVAAEMRRALR
ncbi:minor capsid protein [Streptomyces lincolnensis]|uniref:minor capsid protein n=1 Tax=Streptomyces lincolnensis TaxID=1915 RepID=UPI001E5C1B06|nr:minor capsid protein [Streptomyces lincolnensis]MCD7440234.1 minor capsid protein [Streptomyces lincolnensis]